MPSAAATAPPLHFARLCTRISYFFDSSSSVSYRLHRHGMDTVTPRLLGLDLRAAAPSPAYRYLARDLGALFGRFASPRLPGSQTREAVTGCHVVRRPPVIPPVRRRLGT
ncbi:hypothetical protein WA026_009439, partial [Henosepilachna vigintioctopunctata]